MEVDDRELPWEAAGANSGVRDMEASVRRAEGGEGESREADDPGEALRGGHQDKRRETRDERGA